MNSDKQRAVRAAIERLDKQYGAGTVMPLAGDNFGAIPDIPVTPTGSLALDAALGVGGLPRGRIVEIFGPEMAGKTTMCLHFVAEAQRAGGVCAYVDVEHALDVAYAKAIGVDVGALLVSQPDCGEQALEIVDQLARTGAVDLVVVDSVAALTPRAEIEGEMGDAHMGLQARLMSQALRKICAVASKQNCTVVFTNQLRQRTGVVFGNPEAVTGGNALKFYASVRMDIRRVGQVKEGEALVGTRARVKVVKNKCAPPFLEAEFVLLRGGGVDRGGELLDAAVRCGLAEESQGCYFSVDPRDHLGFRKRAVGWAICNEAVIRASALGRRK